MSSPNYDETELSVSVSELSVDNDDELPANITSSKLLKFGVDRILSDDITSERNPPKGPALTLSAVFNATHQVYQPSQLNFLNKDDVNRHLPTPTSIGSAPPCSGCVTSLFRCCRLHVSDLHLTHPYPTTFYTGRCSLLHTPKPLRPYTNLILESEITDRNNSNSSGNLSKRKRSWSRAVFSNLQRKGLEKRFQIQKYITKPDRRQLAATLGLTDAQVKVWFQNRRMKWRHNKELKYHASSNANSGSINSTGSSHSSVSSSSSSPSSTTSSSSNTNLVKKPEVSNVVAQLADNCKYNKSAK